MTCRVDITRDETLKDTLLGLGEQSGGKPTARVRYLSCPSCQRRITKQYAFYCADCRSRICIYCTAPGDENLCMPCADKSERLTEGRSDIDRLRGSHTMPIIGFKGHRRALAGKNQ